MSPGDLRTGKALRHYGQLLPFSWMGKLRLSVEQRCAESHSRSVAFPRLRPFPLPCRYLSHTELAPLRAPLIPMEHCTTRFFETCDLDNDKYIALDEWAGCFGIKESECASSGAAGFFVLLPHLRICPLCPSWFSVPSELASALPVWVGLAPSGDFLILLYQARPFSSPSSSISTHSAPSTILGTGRHLERTQEV